MSRELFSLAPRVAFDDQERPVVSGCKVFRGPCDESINTHLEHAVGH